ncbi:IS630 family transposase, partial [Shewanella oncorhynchi]
GYDDIVEQCSIAWNTFIEKKARVIELCTRPWTILTS